MDSAGRRNLKEKLGRGRAFSHTQIVAYFNGRHNGTKGCLSLLYPQKFFEETKLRKRDIFDEWVF
jgi:hypothetical protein